jgi:hypothetical protein
MEIHIDFSKESTMTRLEKVQYTAKDHSDDDRLDIEVSSPGTPGIS